MIDVLESKAPYLLKLGLLSIHRLFVPKYITLICFVISSLQNWSVIISVAKANFHTESNSAFKIFSTVSNIFCPSEALIYDQKSELTAYVFLFVLIYGFGYQIFACFFLIKVKYEKHLHECLLRIFGISFYIHPLVLFFPFHRFLLHVVYHTHKEEFYFFGVPDVAILTLAYFLLFCNMCGTLVQNLIFHDVIKSGDLLAKKTNMVAMVDTIRKIIIPFVLLFQDLSFIPSLLLAMNLIDLTLKDYFTFRVLPYYRIKILRCSVAFQASQTTLSFVIVMAKIFENKNSGITWYIIGFSWIILSLIMVKGYSNYLSKILIKIITSPNNELNLHHLVHKKHVYSFLQKERNIVHKNQKVHDPMNFIFQTAEVANLDEQTPVLNTTHRPTFIRAGRKILYEALELNPKSDLVKVCLAHHLVKYENSYANAYDLIQDVIENYSSWPIRISMALIRLELQRKLTIRYGDRNIDSEDSLDMKNYIKLYDINKHLLRLISEQLKPQSEFWENFNHPKPDMQKLFEKSNHVEKKKNKIFKFWKKNQDLFSNDFQGPFLSYGVYLLLVNNNPAEADKYLKKFSFLNKKSVNFAQKDYLTQSSIFCPLNVRVSISGCKKQMGKILEASSSIKTILGFDPNYLKGKNVNLIMPPFFRNRHNDYLNKHANLGRGETLNVTHLALAYNINRYIVPIWIHVKMDPKVELRLSFISIMRKAGPDYRRIILMRDDWKIDGFSVEIADDLRIHHKREDRNFEMHEIWPNFCEIVDYLGMYAETKLEKKKISHVYSLNTIEAIPLKRKQTYSKTQANQADDWDRKILQHRSTLQDFSVLDPFLAGLATVYLKPAQSLAKLDEGNQEENLIPYKAKLMLQIYNTEFVYFLILNPIDSGSEEFSEIVESQDKGKDHSEIESPTRGRSEAKLFTGTNRSNFKELSFQGDPESSKRLVTEDRVRVKKVSLKLKKAQLNLRAEFDQFSMNSSSYNDKHEAPLVFPLTKELPENFSRFAEADHQEKLSPRSSARVNEQVSVLKDLNSFPPHQTMGEQAKHKFEVKFNGQNLVEEYQHEIYELEHNLRKTDLDGTIQRQGSSVRAGTIDNKNMKIYKAVDSGIKAIVYKRKSVLLGFLFAFVILLVTIAMLSLSGNTLFAVDSLNCKNKIIKAAYDRFRALKFTSYNAALNTFVRFGVLDWEHNLEESVTIAAGYLEFINTNLLKTNRELIDNVKQDQSLIEVLFEKNVNFYDFEYKKGKKKAIQVDSVEAIDLISEKILSYLSNNKISQFETEQDQNKDLYFLSKNILNDLMISSEKIISTASHVMSEDFALFRKIGTIILISCVALVVPFSLFELGYLFTLNRESDQFSEILFKFSNQNVKQCYEQILGLKKVFDTIPSELQLASGLSKTLTEKTKLTNQEVKLIRRPNNSRVYLNNFIVLMKIMPLAITTWILLGIYYEQTRSGLNDLEELTRQEIETLELDTTITTLNILSANIFISFDMTYRNNPILSELGIAVEKTKSQNNIVDKLRDQDGRLYDFQNEVLFNISCEKILNYEYQFSTIEYLYTMCNVGSINRHVGLVNILAEINQRSSDLYTTLQNLTGPDSSIDLLKGSAERYEYLIDTTIALSSILYQETAKKYLEGSTSLQNEGILLAGLSPVLLAVIGVICWNFSIKILLNKVVERKHILKLIPIKNLLANRFLRQYLIDNSDGQLDNIKQLL